MKIKPNLVKQFRNRVKLFHKNYRYAIKRQYILSQGQRVAYIPSTKDEWVLRSILIKLYFDTKNSLFSASVFLGILACIGGAFLSFVA